MQVLRLFLVWDSEGISESEDRVVDQLFEACDADSDSESSSSGDKKKRKKKSGKKGNKGGTKDSKKKKKRKMSSSSESESAQTISSESSSSTEAFLPSFGVQSWGQYNVPNPHLSGWSPDWFLSI